MMSLFFSVFVVACNIIQSLPTPGTSTQAVSITLTLRHPRGPTDLPLSATPTAALPASTTDSAGEPPVVAFEGLRCYAMPGAQSMCLGSVKNLLDTALEQVAISVQVQADDDQETVLRSQTIRLDQAVLPPHASAPYRVLWNVAIAADERVNVRLERALPVADPARFARVRVVSAEGRMREGRYALSAVIMNDDVVDAVDVRAVLMLRASDGAVAGYRVAQVSERLPPGAQASVEIEMIPHQMRGDLRPSLHVEALRAPVGQ